MEFKATVYFEDPFWVGVFERHDEEGYSIAKAVFGKEPSDPELYQFFKDEYKSLEFGKPTAESKLEQRHLGYKREQRKIRKYLAEHGVANKAHEVMRQQLEANKKERQVITKEQKEREKEHKYQLLQEKRKEKKRGH